MAEPPKPKDIAQPPADRRGPDRSADTEAPAQLDQLADELSQEWSDPGDGQSRQAEAD